MGAGFLWRSASFHVHFEAPAVICLVFSQTQVNPGKSEAGQMPAWGPAGAFAPDASLPFPVLSRIAKKYGTQTLKEFSGKRCVGTN